MYHALAREYNAHGIPTVAVIGVNKEDVLNHLSENRLEWMPDDYGNIHGCTIAITPSAKKHRLTQRYIRSLA